MTEPKEMIIVGRDEHTYKTTTYSIVKLVSTDAYAPNPYMEIKIFDYNFYKQFSTIMQPGFLLSWTPDDNNWKLLQEYSSPNNQFEIATVLGRDRSGYWLIYGNKIGKTVMHDTNQKTHGIQRGDDLLLRKFPSIKNYVIVHNINQAQLIYQKQKYGPQYTK